MHSLRTTFYRLPVFLVAWWGGWLTTYVLASLAHSSQVIQGLKAIPVDVPLQLSLYMMLSDLGGLFLGYGSLLFVVTGLSYLLVAKLLPWQRASLFAIAGSLAMAATLLAMHPLLHVTLIAGARSSLGFTLQCLAGAIGAWVFFILRQHYQRD